MLRVWNYSDRNNCWDFVRKKLEGKVNLSKFELDPKDLIEINKRYKETVGNFIQCERDEYSVACHYRGNRLTHVGIVLDGKVHHVSEKGYRVDPFKLFERLAKTRYWIHVNLKHS